MRVPATAGQAALFFADQKWQEGYAYNTATVMTVHGSVERDRLDQACRHLTGAFPALRLRVGLDEWTGEVVQSFSTDDPEIEWHDLEGADHASITKLIDASTARPFDADDGALIRFVVVRTGPRDITLAMVTHHLTIDGPCYARLGRNLANSIAGRLQPQSVDDYLDLVRYVQQEEQRARAHDHGYWERRIPAGIALNPWQPSGAATATAGHAGCLLSELDGRALARLEAAATAAGIRLFPVLAAAVHHALPMAGSSLTSVAAATSVRPPDGSRDEVYGYFINQVPLTVSARGRSVLDLAAREAPRWRADLRRRNYPFIDLAHRIDRRSPIRLDTAMVSYRKTPRVLAWERDGLRYRVDLYPRFLIAKTDLCVRLYHHDGWMEIEVQWGRDIPAGLGERFQADLLGALREPC